MRREEKERSQAAGRTLALNSPQNIGSHRYSASLLSLLLMITSKVPFFPCNSYLFTMAYNALHGLTLAQASPTVFPST
jgi:hypothetical protein